MIEFGDIFFDQLTTTVFIYGSMGFLVIYACAVTWTASRSSEERISFDLSPAS
jgi:hypothetical protein